MYGRDSLLYHARRSGGMVMYRFWLSRAEREAMDNEAERIAARAFCQGIWHVIGIELGCFVSPHDKTAKALKAVQAEINRLSDERCVDLRRSFLRKLK